MKIRLVVATRESKADFFKKTATGRSLAFNHPPFLEMRVFTSNARGLPALYNEAIRQSADDPATLVFAHDDLHLLDYFWYSRLKEGLAQFDVVGLAGNKRRVPRQPGWAFIDTSLTWDARENLSGVVGHGKTFPPSNLSVFGPPRQRVKLLDGLLLAAESETLHKHGILFDESFDFHFYDLDFCRQVELKGLSCGTWDLPLIHESGGHFGSPGWQASYRRYLEKWEE
jgi:Glycosyltransferase like family